MKATPKKRWPEFRPIFSFGVVDMARQHLAVSALRPLMHIDRRQHATQNGGQTEIVDVIMQAIASKEYKYVATCDIKDFFPTVSRDWLRQFLPIGEEATSTLLVEESQDRTRYTGYGLNRVCLTAYPLAVASRRGLPQGACSSPMIADHLVGHALARINLPAGTVVENIADNFVVMGRRRVDVEMAVYSLRDAFERQPAGPFQLTDDGIRRIADGFEFLGYHFRRRKGRDIAVPTRANILKLHLKVKHHVNALRRGGPRERLRASLNGWVNAFAAAPRAENVVRNLLLDLLRMQEVKELWLAFEHALAPLVKRMNERLQQYLLNSVQLA